MPYRHRYVDGAEAEFPPGKVICVGRNYAEHAAELDNPVPEEPLLFLKPATAIVPFDDTLVLSRRRGIHHYETEMTLLIGSSLTECNEQQACAAIAGVGVGLDLTLRSRQNHLKAQGYPWERAKAFDGSCVLSSFAKVNADLNLQNIPVRLTLNAKLVQDGNTSQMLFGVLLLLCEISREFTLIPGDVVMTGTPKGVGELHDGDSLKAELGELVSASARVSYV